MTRPGWSENKLELDAYRRVLRAAVEQADHGRVAKVCEQILRWGGVWARNGAYLTRRQPVLLDELLHLRAVIGGDCPPPTTPAPPAPRTAGRTPATAHTATTPASVPTGHGVSQPHHLRTSRLSGLICSLERLTLSDP